ncbi:MAG TPA: extracellular solute-binding protein [Beijerinckiaceae bacterium]|nr:extracellular solute-binding protein [Beijerinckiaceae bacterium]
MTIDIRLIAVGLIALFSCAPRAPASAADQALIDAAKKEGHVTWYTSLIIDQFARPAAAAFEKKYGIKVDYVRAEPTEIAIRIVNEAKAGHVQADAFDGFTIGSLAKDNYIESWLPDEAKRMPKDYYDPAGHWIATNVFVLTPGFNTELVPRGTEPKTYEDLLDPKWKGKMIWSSNISASSAPGFIGSVLTEMGEEKGMAYLQKLAKQDIASTGGSARQVLDQVISGDYALSPRIFNHHTVISAAKGAPAGWIPMEPVMIVFNIVSLLAHSPHPNAGKLLIDFLESEDGQKLFRDADYLPANPAVPPKDPSLTPQSGHFRATIFSPETLDAQMPHWGDVFHRLFR